MMIPESTWRSKHWRYVRTPAGVRERMTVWMDPINGGWHWSCGGHTSEAFVESTPCRMDAERTMRGLGWRVE
jgi:hypothetical protein